MTVSGRPEGDDLEELKSENAELRSKLARFQDLEERFLAHRIYESARKSLVRWLSAGGIAIVLLGYIGFELIADRVVEIVVPVVEKRAHSDAQEELSKRLEELKTDLFISNFEGADLRRSQRGNTEIELEFVNKLREAVVVYWKDYDGNEIEYFRLEPGQSRMQMTYVTHPWIVKRESTDEPVSSIVANVNERQLLIEETK